MGLEVTRAASGVGSANEMTFTVQVNQTTGEQRRESYKGTKICSKRALILLSKQKISESVHICKCINGNFNGKQTFKNHKPGNVNMSLKNKQVQIHRETPALFSSLLGT